MGYAARAFDPVDEERARLTGVAETVLCVREMPAARYGGDAEAVGSVGEVPAVQAISVGLVGGEILMDLDYPEDSGAEFDFNLVTCGGDRIIESSG